MSSSKLVVRKARTKWGRTQYFFSFTRVREIVRHSTARVISSVARIDVPENRWPDLLGFLNEACASTNPSHREVGTYILYALFEVIGDYFMNHTEALYQLFNKSIVDPESKKVRVTTVL